MTIKISELAAKVREIGHSEPDVLYADRYEQLAGIEYNGSRCRYTVAGEPACLVGKALFELGVPLKELAAFDDSDEASINSVIRNNPDVFDLDDQDLSDFVSNAQGRQDRQMSWGDAVLP